VKNSLFDELLRRALAVLVLVVGGSYAMHWAYDEVHPMLWLFPIIFALAAAGLVSWWLWRRQSL